MGAAVLKTAKPRLLTPLTCCRQLLRYSHLQRTVSRRSSEISCYNSASGCADWHTIDNVIEMMMMTRTTMVYSVNVGHIHMCLLVLRPVHTKLGCEFACKLLSSTSAIAIQHYSMQEPVLILPSVEDRKLNWNDNMQNSIGTVAHEPLRVMSYMLCIKLGINQWLLKA